MLGFDILSVQWTLGLLSAGVRFVPRYTSYWFLSILLFCRDSVVLLV